jgi:hypothetical protein
VRSGVYLTTHVDNETGLPVFYTTKGYSLFDATSKIWGCNHLTPEAAAKNPDFEFAWQHKSWQGLAEEPKP